MRGMPQCRMGAHGRCKSVFRQPPLGNCGLHARLQRGHTVDLPDWSPRSSFCSRRPSHGHRRRLHRTRFSIAATIAISTDTAVGRAIAATIAFAIASTTAAVANIASTCMLRGARSQLIRAGVSRAPSGCSPDHICKQWNPIVNHQTQAATCVAHIIASIIRLSASPPESRLRALPARSRQL